MATNMSLSQKSIQKAHDLANVLWRMNKGRSKVNGVEFYVIPASDGKSAHWTAVDARGCTCKGHRRNGHCTHVEAVMLHNHREATVVVPMGRTYRDLFGADEMLESPY